MTRAHRRDGDISLYELLRLHGVDDPATRAAEIRLEAERAADPDCTAELTPEPEQFRIVDT
jgi:hypothetical protein